MTETRDSEWQWHQLGRMQVCTSLQTDNRASTPPLSFLQARCPSCRLTNSVKALKAMLQLHGKEIPHNASFHVSLARYYSKLLADSIYFRNGRLHKTIKFSPYSNYRM